MRRKMTFADLSAHVQEVFASMCKDGVTPEENYEGLSNASASLHAIGVDVYNPDGSDRGIITVMSELKDKWDDLTDAQQAKIAFDVAATRLKASLCMKKFILE